MATKKKTTAAAAAEAATDKADQTENSIQEETAKVTTDTDASDTTDTTDKQESPEPEAAKEPEQEPDQDQDQDQEPEAAKELEPITKDTPCPFEATVSVALAVLRKTTGPATSEMLRPVATLKQGTKVTVTAVRDGGCLLRNGLWIATEYLTK